MAVFAFFLFLFGLAVGAGAAKSVGDRRLAAREEEFKRLVSGEQEQQGPYRTQLVHDGHCAEPKNVVEQLVCTMRVQELEDKIKELEAKLPKPPTGIMMPWGWRENPKPKPPKIVLGRGHSSDVWK